MDQETAKMLQEHINKHVTSTGKGEKAHPVYAVSLPVSILLFRPVSV
jgi:hypothetical protein